MFFRAHKYLLVAFFVFSIISCSSGKYVKYSKTGFSMSTYLTITLFSDNKKEAEKILTGAFDLAERLSEKVDRRNEKGIIYKLNKEKTLVIEDDFTLNLIKLALKNSEFTNGAFDPALGNIIKIWGIEDGNTKIPTKRDIDKTLLSCGVKNILINGRKVTLKNNIQLDLGGIAKEVIMLSIDEYIGSKKIGDYLINAGGDISARGLFEGKRKWKVAIQDPFDANKYLGYIEASGYSIITSGDYQRYFTGSDGKRYHHIIDPKTGAPADNGLHSVTVITKNPKSDDLLTTTGHFVMGGKKGLEFAENNGLYTIFISGSKEKPEINYSKGILAEKDKDGYWKYSLK
jgi:FAD:protein FMN transferase